MRDEAHSCGRFGSKTGGLRPTLWGKPRRADNCYGDYAQRNATELIELLGLSSWGNVSD